VNDSRSHKGLQLGLLNITEDLKALQIALVNVAKNAFLPVFASSNFNFD
jgi:hypothetical protein